MTRIIKHSATIAQQELVNMLTHRRPARSKTEVAFVDHYIDSLPQIYSDSYGNRYCKIGKAPSVLWSCHTDTVHTKDGNQSIVIDGDNVRLAKTEKQSSCLGGDDSAGVWIMRQMIKRRIEGLYIFHRDEEVGGLGSDFIAKNNARELEHIQVAIALDRRGYDSVITHQGLRTASDDFAKSLSKQLGGLYKPDSGGTFTDTANYKHLIPECSNLSCGYNDAHSALESQNIRFASQLLDRLCEIDFSKITVARNPADIDDDLYYSRGSSFFDDDWHFTKPARRSRRDTYQELLDLVSLYPREVADFLESQGFTADDIADQYGIYTQV